jgi:hypothetical protein
VAGAAGSRSARYVFPVRGCRVAYGHSHSYHPATDIFTDRGRAFVAPTDGVVDEVSRVDRWDPTSDHGVDRGGLSVSIIGIDGVRYYGSHLQSIAPGITHGAASAPGDSWAASTTPATHAPPRPMSTSACPGHPSGHLVDPPWSCVPLAVPGCLAGRSQPPAPAIQAAHAAAGSDIPACRIRC